MTTDLHPLHAQASMPRSRTRRSTAVSLFVLCILGSGVLSCSGDTLNGPPARSATQLYWTLQLNSHAVNLALTPPYNTVQLTAVPLNPFGTRLQGLGAVTYTTTDTAVTVSPTGVVTAHAVTGGTQVIATLQDLQQSLTHADTVLIQVTPTAPALPLRLFSLQPAQGDSAKRAIDYIDPRTQAPGYFGWPVHVVDAAGNTICDATGCTLTLAYTSSDTAVATIDRATGFVTTRDTGRIVLTVQTVAYGVPVRDSVAFTVGYALLSKHIVVGNGHTQPIGFDAPLSKEVLGIGATMTFCNFFEQKINILFDQPQMAQAGSIRTLATNDDGTNVFGPPTGTGNILAIGGDTSIDVISGSLESSIVTDCNSRLFVTPGVYHWHSTLLTPTDTFTVQIKQEGH